MTPPAAAAATRARVATPHIAPPRPRPARRISGPARTPARNTRPSQSHAKAESGLLPGLLGALGGISQSGALDRLIRGRIWIAVIAFALIGIVTLQLLVLQLNASIGRSLVRESQLQRENAALSIEGSELSAGERVESKAAQLGMQLVSIGALRFVTSDPHADIARAAAALKAPAHGAGSSEGAAATSSGTSAAGGSPEAAASTPAPAESPSTTEASAPASSPTDEVGASAGEASAPASEAPASEAPASEAPAASSGAPAAAVVGGAGGVGAGQPSGAG